MRYFSLLDRYKLPEKTRKKEIFMIEMRIMTQKITITITIIIIITMKTIMRMMMIILITMRRMRVNLTS